MTTGFHQVVVAKVCLSHLFCNTRTYISDFIDTPAEGQNNKILNSSALADQAARKPEVSFDDYLINPTPPNTPLTRHDTSQCTETLPLEHRADIIYTRNSASTSKCREKPQDMSRQSWQGYEKTKVTCSSVENAWKKDMKTRVRKIHYRRTAHSAARD